MAVSKTMMFQLKSKLFIPRKGWSCLLISSELLGQRKRVRITGKINGVAFSACANPARDNCHAVVVNRQLREDLGLVGDEEVEVEFIIDDSPPEMAIPPDLARALKENPESEKTFKHLAYSHRKEYIRWIDSAKNPETRIRRIEQTVRKITITGSGK